MASRAIINKFQVGQKTGGQWDEYDHTLWDSVRWDLRGTAQTNQSYADLKREYVMFQNTVGQQGGGFASKNYADTNMPTPGAMPQGKRFTVHAIAIQFNEWGYDHSQPQPAGVSEAELFSAMGNFMEQATLEFRIDGKAELGMWTLQELVGLNWTTSSSLTAASVDALTTQMIRSSYKLNLPIILPSLQPFSLRLTLQREAENPADIAKVRVLLKGKMESMS